MGAISESCTVCKRAFDVQLRWQMEERDGAFSFFCSRKCYEASATAEGGVACDACGKRFQVDLVSQVVALKTAGRPERHYACSLACREQLVAEAAGAKLGDASLGAWSLSAPTSPSSPSVSPSSGSLSTASSTVAELDGGTGAILDRVPMGLSEGSPSVAAASTSPAGVDAALVQQPREESVRPPLMPLPSRREQRDAREPLVNGAGVPRRIAIFNHKGGTGKTTTAVSVAVGLAARGKRVLLVDTDAQGNVAASLGLKCDRSLYHVLVMGLAPAEVAQPVRTNLDVLGSNETLAAAELYLAGRRERDRVLRDRLAPTSQLYDVVILDCSPSLSLLNQNALVFAESILIPVACDYLSLIGVRQVLKTVKNVNQLLQHPVRIGAVIPTMYDGRAKICQDALATLREHFGPRCLAPIRATAKVKEAPAHHKTIFEWAADSTAASDYEAVVDALWNGVAAEGAQAAHRDTARGRAEAAGGREAVA